MASLTTTPNTPAPVAEPGLLRNADYALATALLAVMCVLLVPLPTPMLDGALVINVSSAVLILVITLSCRQPLDFSTFPSLLLFTTLTRLSLNVASTRLILSKGHAGSVIQAFGDFVVGGNLMIGLVIFLILIVIQFVVITKGSNRISEVAARFTLDAMPGKQMAIDAELNAGLINEQTARSRREVITAEAEFYGAMDGAGKFVRGDAVAGLIITVINILGGVGIGLMDGLTAADSLKKYSVLTVGDGLVSQIPALLITIASGVLVTKQRGQHQLSREITAQFMFSPRATRIAAGIVLMLGLAPGLPIAPFTVMAVVLFGFAAYSKKHEGATGNRSSDPAATAAAAAAAQEAAAAQAAGASGGVSAPDASPEALTELLRVDRLALEIGYRLIPMVSGDKRSPLLDHIAMLRRQFASQLGFVVPPIRMKDNLALEPNAYRLLISGQEVARGSLYPDHFLAMSAGFAREPIAGVKTTDPTFGLPATWVPSSRKAEAESLGYTVVDAESVLVTHLTEVLKEHAAEILSRDDVQKLLDRVKETAPSVVAELVPDTLGIGVLQAVFCNLLRERVPVRNLPGILETLADHGRKIKDPEQLTELVRQRLSRTIVELHAAPGGTVHALTLEPQFEQTLSDALGGSNDPKVTAILSPIVMRKLQEQAVAAWEAAQARGKEGVVLVRASVRRYLADLFRAMSPRIPVLSFNEVTAAKSIDTAGTITMTEPAPAARAGSAGARG